MLIRVILFLLCASVGVLSSAQTPMYKVSKIKTVGKYHVIYAVKNDSTYKIVSKKEKINDGRRIRKNESYPFMISIIKSLAGPEVDCFSFDEKTAICKEPEVELVLASNLKGLCLIEN